MRAERADGSQVRAYLPNTARLTDLLVPGAPVVLVASDQPGRRTGWTVTRVWDGAWVALHAGAAADLVAEHLEAGRALEGWPRPVAVRREVVRDGHRFDLELDLDDGRVAVVEVKSLSRARDRVAPLSSTPSSRGVAHLATLTALAGAGHPTAVVFVVQRGDVDTLDLSAPADPGWTAAVRRARRGGVDVLAHACHVTPDATRLGPSLRVRDDAQREAPREEPSP